MPLIQKCVKLSVDWVPAASTFSFRVRHVCDEEKSDRRTTVHDNNYGRSVRANVGKDLRSFAKKHYVIKIAMMLWC